MINSHICEILLVIAFKRVGDKEARFKRNGTVANFCFFVSSSRLTSSIKLHCRKNSQSHYSI